MPSFFIFVKGDDYERVFVRRSAKEANDLRVALRKCYADDGLTPRILVEEQDDPYNPDPDPREEEKHLKEARGLEGSGHWAVPPCGNDDCGDCAVCQEEHAARDRERAVSNCRCADFPHTICAIHGDPGENDA